MALMSYGYWVAFTTAGNKVCDEMNGLWQFFLLIGGVIFLITAIIMF